MKKDIILDWDDFMIPYIPNLVLWSNDVKKTKLSVDDFESYNFHEAWGISQSEADALTSEFEATNFFREIKTQSGEEMKMLQTLKAAGYTLNVMTARTSLLREVTTYQARNNFPNMLERIDFSRGEGGYLTARPKGEVICEIYEKSTVMGFGDDSPTHVLNVREKLPQVPIVLMRRNWNRDHTDDSLKIKKIVPITKHEQFTQYILARTT